MFWLRKKSRVDSSRLAHSLHLVNSRTKLRSFRPSGQGTIGRTCHDTVYLTCARKSDNVLDLIFSFAVWIHGSYIFLWCCCVSMQSCLLILPTPSLFKSATNSSTFPSSKRSHGNPSFSPQGVPVVVRLGPVGLGRCWEKFACLCFSRTAAAKSHLPGWRPNASSDSGSYMPPCPLVWASSWRSIGDR